jgi:hypothetical protein
VGILVLGLLARPALRRKELLLPALVMVGSGYSFLFIYYLPRYVLPVTPFLLVFAAGALWELVRRPIPAIVCAVVVAALSASTLADRPLRGNGEWDLGHLRVVEAYRDLASYLESDRPGGRVYAPFPLDRVLKDPRQGFVREALQSGAFHRPEDLPELVPGDVIVIARPGNSPGLVEELGLSTTEPDYRFEDGRILIEAYRVED